MPEGLLETPAAEEVETGLGDGAGDGGAGEGSGAGGSGNEGDGASGAGEGQGEGAGGEEFGSGDPEGDSGEKLTGSKLWNASKEQLAAMDPKLRSAIQAEIHKADRLARMLPEGPEKLLAVVKSLDQLAETAGTPAEKVIADTLAERNYFREFDDLLTNNPKGFVDKITGEESTAPLFDALAPEVYAKYSQTDPEGFAGLVSRTVLQHMAGNDVPLQFKVLRTFLPQLPEGPAKDQVIAAVEALWAWNGELQKMAQMQPKAKPGTGKDSKDSKGTKDELATREQQLAEREQQVTLQSWNNEAIGPGTRMVNAEADRAAGKNKLTSDERKTVMRLVSEELDVRLAGNTEYGKAMRGYLQAGNKAEFLQRLNAERKKLIPSAARRAVADVLDQRKAAAKKQGTGVSGQGSGKQQQQQQHGAAAGQGDGAEKVEWISGYPSTLNLVVDLNRTTNAMLQKKRAFVKGKQTPVAWK